MLTGKRIVYGDKVTKIKDTGKTARKIDPHELIKGLGAEVIEGTLKTGGGVPGVLAGAHFFARHQRKLRAARKMGAPVGNHVRLWIRGKEMSIAGKVSGYNFPPDGDRIKQVVTVECVDGKRCQVDTDDIEKVVDFGSALERMNDGTVV